MIRSSFLLAAVALASLGWGRPNQGISDDSFHVPLGMGSPPAAPEGNPVSKAKVRLGRLLFFDKRLSRDRTISCATCHDPNKGWSDGSSVSAGIGGRKGTRNAPTILNAAYLDYYFWDGRAESLEEQSKEPIRNPNEMGFSARGVVGRLSSMKGYEDLFKAAFGDKAVTADRVAQAIASFERTLITGNSPVDRYFAGDAKALTASQKAGLDLFLGKAGCAVCHDSRNFTDGDFHNTGVGLSAENPDLGRYAVTGLAHDRGAFKTPTLRNLPDTAPYMHDGSMKTLAEVVDFYDRGGEPNSRLDADLHPLHLTAQEKRDLVAFLRALEGEKVAIDAPTSFPR